MPPPNDPSQKLTRTAGERVTFSLSGGHKKADLKTRATQLRKSSVSGYLSSLVKWDIEQGLNHDTNWNWPQLDTNRFKALLTSEYRGVSDGHKRILKDISDRAEQLDLPAALKVSAVECLHEAVEDYWALSTRKDASVDRSLSLHGENWLTQKLAYPTDKSVDIQLGWEGIVKDLAGFLPRTWIDQKVTSEANLIHPAHLVRAGAAAHAKILYLFPFTRSYFRRQYWGVIPYGEYKTFGIALHKNSSNSLINDFKKRAAGSPGGKISDDEIERWISLDVKPHLANQASPGRIHFRDDFVEGELFEFLWHLSGDRDFETFRSPFPRNLKSFKDLLNYQNLNDHDLVILDLGDPIASESKENPNHPWVVIPFHHPLKVPVGIGFSLNALPNFLFKHCWADLLVKIHAWLNDNNNQDATAYCSALSKAGIKTFKQ